VDRAEAVNVFLTLWKSFANYIKKLGESMDSINALKTAVADLTATNTAIITKINGLNQLVTDLQATVTGMAEINPELDALVQLIKDEKAKLDALI